MNAVPIMVQLPGIEEAHDAIDRNRRVNNAVTVAIILTFSLFVGVLVALFLDRIHRLEIENRDLTEQIGKMTEPGYTGPLRR